MRRICKDPALTYLKELGYNIVRLPSEKVKPLDLIGGDDSGQNWLGPIQNFCQSDRVPPTPLLEATVAIDMKRTNALTLEAGLELLHNFLASFGVGSARLQSAYSKARSLELSFDRPSIHTVDPGTLGQWLLTATPIAGHPFVERYFKQGCTACVITETLTSRSFRVAAFDKNHQRVEVDLGALKDVLDAGVEVRGGREDHGTLSYTGSRDLTFGFKAFQLERSAGIWIIRGNYAGEPFAGEIDAATPATAAHLYDDDWLSLQGLGDSPNGDVS